MKIYNVRSSFKIPHSIKVNDIILYNSHMMNEPIRTYIVARNTIEHLHTKELSLDGHDHDIFLTSKCYLEN